MGGIKVPEEFEVNEDHLTWLKAMAEKHGLPDSSKALRVVLDYAMQEGDEPTIFEEIRCHHC